MLARGRKRTVPFIADGALRLVDADYRDANRIAPAVPELHHLIPKAVDDAADLFDRRLRQDLDLDSDLDGSPAVDLSLSQ